MCFMVALLAIISRQSEVHAINIETSEYVPPWWERLLVHCGFWRTHRPPPMVDSQPTTE